MINFLASVEIVTRYLISGRKKSYIGSYKGQHHGYMSRDGKKNIWVGNYIGRNYA